MRIITVDDDKEFYSKISQVPYLTVHISPPKQIQNKIKEIQRQLRAVDDRQVYHHPSYFHITVKGIGWLGEQIEEKDLTEIRNKIQKVTSSVSPFSITLKGAKVWPSVIYTDVEEGIEPIRELHVKITQELKEYGVTYREHEGETMHPHLTVVTFAAHDSDKLIDEVTRFGETDIGSMRVDKIRLIKTIPGKMSRRLLEGKDPFDEITSFPLGDNGPNVTV